MAMVGAGAMGNIVDRFLFSGMVKDIIYTPWSTTTSNWGTYNPADSFVFIGLILFLLANILTMIKDKKKQKQIK
jgi:signal peptidase II